MTPVAGKMPAPFAWLSLIRTGAIKGRTGANCRASPLPGSDLPGSGEFLRQWNQFVRREDKPPSALAEIRDSLHRDRVCSRSLGISRWRPKKHYNFVIFSLPCLLLPTNPLPCET